MTLLLLILSVLFGLSSALFEGNTCAKRCNHHYSHSLPCQCNTLCTKYRNCCPDYSSVCLSGAPGANTCKGRCETHLSKTANCQCNSQCARFQDCCSDYQSVCSGSHAGTHGSHVTPHGIINLDTIADELWAVDPEKVDITNITINIGGHTSHGKTQDVSSSPLFTKVHTDVFQSPIYKALFALYDNYNPHRGVADPITAADQKELDTFLELLLASPVMENLVTFLTDNKLFSGDMTAFKAKLFSLWFQPYARSHGGSKDSSAFEHVFIGEYKGSIVEGFHNWVRFYKEEQAGHINYLGYMHANGPQMLEFTFDWNNHLKAIDSFIIGSSPAFDIALGTLCFMTKPSSACSFTLNNHQFKIQQYDNSNAPGLQLATAYTVF